VPTATATTTSGRDRPTGRNEVVDALLDAATRLFAARGPANVSVRDVAEAAGVNHGLVHRHFGSKRALLGAVLDRLAARVAATTAAGELPHDADLDAYWRVLARAILDGEDVSDLQHGHPTIAHLLATAEADGMDPSAARVETARTVAYGLGARLFAPFIRAAVGLADDEAAAALDVAG
jgi:AcrR family transcriptional regulator